MARIGTALRLAYRRFAHGDRLAGFRLLVRLGAWLVPGYRFVDPRLDGWDDAGFNAFLEQFDEREALNADRHWMLAQLVRLTHAVPGDTAECGVYRGASSWLICRALRGSGKEHHLFDSFEGLSQPAPEDGPVWQRGDLACDEEEVRRRLGAFDNVRFHRGWIPERFGDVADRRFSFVHVDVDLAQPTRDSVEFFYPRLSDGGILMCDDYGQSTCRGARQAIDAFLASRPEKMIELPGGGGFLVKGRSTAA